MKSRCSHSKVKTEQGLTTVLLALELESSTLSAAFSSRQPSCCTQYIVSYYFQLHGSILCVQMLLSGHYLCAKCLLCCPDLCQHSSTLPCMFDLCHVFVEPME